MPLHRRVLLSAAAFTALISAQPLHAQNCVAGTVASYEAMLSCTYGGVVFSGFSSSGIYNPGSGFVDETAPYDSWTVVPTTMVVGGAVMSGFTLQSVTQNQMVNQIDGSDVVERILDFAFTAEAASGNVLNAVYLSAIRPAVQTQLGPDGGSWVAGAYADLYSSDPTHYATLRDALVSVPGSDPEAIQGYCPWTDACGAITLTSGTLPLSLPAVTALNEGLQLISVAQPLDGGPTDGTASASIDGALFLYQADAATVTATPEPAPGLLLGTALIGIGVVQRKRRSFVQR